VHVPLRDVLAKAVVRHEAGGGRIRMITIPLRVDELHVVVHVRQQSGATLHRVLMSNPQFGQGSAELRIVSLGAGEGILQRENQRRLRGSGIRTCCWRQDLSADSGRWVLA